MKYITVNVYYQKVLKLIVKIADTLNEQVPVSFLRRYPAGRRQVGQNWMVEVKDAIGN
jgi:hypothetical protein